MDQIVKNAVRTGAAAGARGRVLAGAAAALAGLAAAEWWRARAAEKARPPTGRFVSIGGLPVHHVEAGEGPPVLLLHGNGATTEDFALSGLLDRLARRHRVVAMDRPGYGYTPRPRDRVWGPAAQAGLIARFIDRIGMERPVVVGHSWGTLPALALALDHPDEVGGLVLMSGPYFPSARIDVWLMAPPALPVVGDALLYTASPLLSRAIFPLLVRRIFSPRPTPRRFRDHFPRELALRPWQLRASAEESGIMIPSAAKLSRRYGELALPVAVVTGDGDRMIEPEQAVRLAGAISGSTLHRMPGIGHMLHYAAPDAIARIVDEVSDRVGGATTG
ncbi:MAG: alpha/beta hydrolase [Methylobacteriaceae bacterium]|nr:alpha/beta hydrolase [Methylobacteriaceae bacterium]